MNDSTANKLVYPDASESETEPPIAPASAPIGAFFVGAVKTWPRVVRTALIMVGLPTLVAAAYWGIIASDVYVSETRYSVRSSDVAPAANMLSAFLSPAGISMSAEDAKMVKDYIRSRDMLDQLQSKLDLRSHYSSKEIDWYSRLADDASAEDFLEYYRDMVDAKEANSAEITILKVRAFDPATAKTIADTILDLSEVLINQWSERITEDTLRFARSELAIAEENVRKTSEALTRFRNQSRSVDPGEETSAVLQIITGLQVSLAETRAELIETQSFMRSDSAQVRKLKAREAALESQIERERKKLAGESGTELARLIDGYAPLILDQELAAKQYSSALTSLELARAEAQRKQRYLIAFVKPDLPDEAVEPERAWNVLTVFFGALLIYGIGGLIWAAITDTMEL